MRARATHRLGGAAVGTVVALAMLAGPAVAAAPPGPRLATVEAIEVGGRSKPALSMAVTTFGPAGERAWRLAGGRLGDPDRVVPQPFGKPTWSGDGTRIAFSAEKGKRSGILVAGSDGSGAHLVPGTARGAEPVLNADGSLLAFARARSRFGKPTPRGLQGFYSSTTTWLLDLRTGKSRRLTGWRNGVYTTPGSFSPDGSLLALTKRVEGSAEPTLLLARTDTDALAELPQPGEEPAFSPDGSQLAFVGYLDPVRIESDDGPYVVGELYAMNVDGTEVRRITRNRKIEAWPSWDPSGQRLAYTETQAETGFAPSVGLLFPTGNSIRQINADGSCAETVRFDPKVALYGAAWQPGAGREAGRIAC